jgi:hypothetical protein
VVREAEEEHAADGVVLVLRREDALDDVAAPPGSAPDLHTVHQCIATGMMNTAMSVSMSVNFGKKSSVPFASSFATSPAMPPTSGCPSA